MLMNGSLPFINSFSYCNSVLLYSDKICLYTNFLYYCKAHRSRNNLSIKLSSQSNYKNSYEYSKLSDVVFPSFWYNPPLAGDLNSFN